MAKRSAYAPLVDAAKAAFAKGDLQTADMRLTEALGHNAMDAEILFLLGSVKARAGNLPAARRLLERSREAAPGNWQAMLGLSNVARAEGRLDAAWAQAETASEVAPREPAVWQQLATLGAAMGRHDLAAAALERLPSLGKRDVGIFLQLALYRTLARDHGNALAAVRQAEAIARRDPRIPQVMAHILARAGQWTELAATAQRWLKAMPDSDAAREALAHAQFEMGDIEKAAETFRPLTDKHDPLPTPLALTYGRLALNAQNYADAERYLGIALDAAPDSPEALVAMARLETFRGQLDQAAGHVEKAIAIDPANTRPYVQLAVIRRGRVEPSHRERMERMWADQSLPPELKANLGFALGDIAYRDKRAEDALGYYDAANAIRAEDGRRRGVRYDRETAEADNVLLREAAPRLASLAPLTRPGGTPRPIFVVGMPRSGTTLVERILAAHPEVHGAGELTAGQQLLDAFVRALRDGGPESVDRILDDHGPDWQRRYLDAMPRRDTSVLVDKMPGNALTAGLLMTLFADAHVVVCRRTAFDTAVSIYRHQFAYSYGWAHDWDDIAHQHVAAARTTAAQLAAFPARGHMVDYDALVAEPEPHIRELIDNVGLRWDDRCLAPHEAEGYVATFSSAQVREPISPAASSGGELFRPLKADYADAINAGVADAYRTG
jgi:tetratricopeptide (TPR) repeat protein